MAGKYILLEKTRVEGSNWLSGKRTTWDLDAGAILEYCTPESQQLKDSEKIALRYIDPLMGIRLECPKWVVNKMTNTEGDLLYPVRSLRKRLPLNSNC